MYLGKTTAVYEADIVWGTFAACTHSSTNPLADTVAKSTEINTHRARPRASVLVLLMYRVRTTRGESVNTRINILQFINRGRISDGIAAFPDTPHPPQNLRFFFVGWNAKHKTQIPTATAFLRWGATARTWDCRSATAL